MNLCPAPLLAGGSAELDGVRVELGAEAASAAADGLAEVVVGLRPEALEPAADGIRTKVEVVEELGSDAYAVCVAERHGRRAAPDCARRPVAGADAWRAAGAAPARGRGPRLPPADRRADRPAGAARGERMSPPDARTPATPPLLRHLNERTVLEAIRERAPISRAEVSRNVGISKPTVSLALQSLLAAGLVREAEPDPERPTTAPPSSSRSATRRWCSGSTSAPAFCAGRSATSRVRSERARTSSSPAPTPPGAGDRGRAHRRD